MGEGCPAAAAAAATEKGGAAAAPPHPGAHLHVAAGGQEGADLQGVCVFGEVRRHAAPETGLIQRRARVAQHLPPRREGFGGRVSGKA